MDRSSRYFCEKCDYRTQRKDTYDRHLKSAKHKLRDATTVATLLKCKTCGKSYAHPSSLSRHAKSCRDKLQQKTKVLTDEVEQLRKQLARAQLEAELRRDALKLDNDRHISVVTNTIPIKTYLKEQCEAATPMLDLMTRLRFRFSSINTARPNSAIEAMSSTIISQLSSLRRPSVLCTDVKRLTFYVKRDSGWVRDTNHIFMKQALYKAFVQRLITYFHSSTGSRARRSRNDTAYHLMIIALTSWSDDPSWAQKKVMRAIAVAFDWKDFRRKCLSY